MTHQYQLVPRDFALRFLPQGEVCRPSAAEYDPAASETQALSLPWWSRHRLLFKSENIGNYTAEHSILLRAQDLCSDHLGSNPKSVMSKRSANASCYFTLNKNLLLWPSSSSSSMVHDLQMFPVSLNFSRAVHNPFASSVSPTLQVYLPQGLPTCFSSGMSYSTRSNRLLTTQLLGFISTPLWIYSK